jgi:hypothetical protein
MRSSPQRAREAFNGVKVFSATMQKDRESLGEKVGEWIARHPNHRIVDIVQTQSSDECFHCIVLTVFYYEPGQ